MSSSHAPRVEIHCIDNFGQAFAYAAAKPDLPVVTPTASMLQSRMPSSEYAYVVALRGELFSNVTGFPNSCFNVASDVLDACYASLLIHLKNILELKGGHDNSYYFYQLKWALNSVKMKTGRSIELGELCEWRSTLCSAWKLENYAQLGSDSVQVESVGAAVHQLLAAVHKLEATVAGLSLTQETLVQLLNNHDNCSSNVKDRQSTNDKDPIRERDTSEFMPAATNLAGVFFIWYAFHLWEQSSGKAGQNFNPMLSPLALRVH